MNKFKPGHEILLEAVQEVLAQTEPDRGSVDRMYTQIEARVTEEIPEKRRQFIIEQVVIACAQTSSIWPHSVSDFLFYQVGKIETMRLLSALPSFKGWQFITCKHCSKHLIVSSYFLETFEESGIDVTVICEDAFESVKGYEQWSKYNKIN